MNSFEKFIIFIFFIILIIIIYKIYINECEYETFIYDYDDDDENKYIEHFKSSLSKIKNKKSKSFFKNISNIVSHKNDKKNTFDDVIKVSENFKKKKDKIDSFADGIYNYKNSFNNKKFNNNSKDTSEALAKFPLFKKKFFEIFN